MAQLIDSESLMWRVTPDLLGVLDTSGFFLRTNPAWQEALGWSADEIAAKPFFDFVHPDDVPAGMAAFAKIKTGEPILNFVNRYRHKDGSYRWLSWNAVPDEAAFFCSARDITEAKDNEASIRHKDLEAELREQFIAILSHDLRNPLTAVSSALRLLPKQEDEDRKAELTAGAQASVKRMAQLIDQVMDFTRARLGGDVGLEFENVSNLHERLQHVVDEIKIGQPSADIHDSYASVSKINCDPNRLCQLLSNLVGNAVSHGSDSKPIKVEMAEDKGFLTLRVANSGKRIPDDIKGSIFEPFARSAYGQTQKGLGLGLFICKKIAEGHGGTLHCESDDERTVFHLRMPLDSAAAGPTLIGFGGDAQIDPSRPKLAQEMTQ